MVTAYFVSSLFGWGVGGGRVINLPTGKTKKGVQMGSPSHFGGQDNTEGVYNTQGKGQAQIWRCASQGLECPAGIHNCTDTWLRGLRRGPSSCTSCLSLRRVAGGTLVQLILLRSQCSFSTRIGARRLTPKKCEQKLYHQDEVTVEESATFNAAEFYVFSQW
jgi:hypothetical protein